MSGSATMTRPTPKLDHKEFQGRLLRKEVVPGVEEDYIREALVAVTGNTDDGGDVILPGAINFKRHPKIVWSHDLRTLVAKVLEYEEWAPGDPRLPADLRAKGLGALWFKVQFDPLDPESFKAFRKVDFHEDLGWSIGYETDPKGFKVLPDGRRQLSKIYVWEGSPTTFGMNLEARTVSVKSILASTIQDLALPEEKAKALQTAIETLVSTGADEAKSYPALEGSMEETQDRLRTALNAYAAEAYGERDADNDWYVSIEGTFESEVVATVRFYSGQGEDVTLRFPYTESDEGVALGEPEEVEVRATVAPAGPQTTPPASGDVTVAEAASLDLSGLDAKAVEDALEEVKKGRVLSAANAAALASAADAISKVLAAAAPKEDEDEETPKKGEAKPAEKVLAREIVPKGKGGTVEAKAVETTPAPEGVEVLDEKDVIELLALANS